MQDFAPLRSILKKCSRLWNVPSLAQAELTTNPRLRTCLGRCFPKLNRIELNASLLEGSDPRLNEVVCHEAAHIAAFVLGPRRSRPHGRQWALLMTAAGFTPATKILGSNCIPRLKQDETRDELFEHYCPVCKFRRTARRPVPRWKCRTCVSAGLRGDLRIRPCRVHGKGVTEHG